MKIEKGVMVVKNGLAWGCVSRDGQTTQYGWVQIEDAPISDPRFCKTVEDLTYEKSPYLEELKTGTLVQVERQTQVKFL